MNKSKYFLGVMPIVALGMSSQAAVLGTYTFDTTGDATGFTLDNQVDAQPANATFSTFAAVGTEVFLSGDLNQGTFATGNADQSVDATGRYPSDAGFDFGQYVGFTITADAGFQVDASGLTFDVNRGGGKAPKDGVLRVSGDGFATFTEFTVIENYGTTNTHNPIALDLSAVAAADALEFRWFFKDATQDINASSIRLDNVQLSGEVVPEPASLALLGLGSLLIAARRRA